MHITFVAVKAARKGLYNIIHSILPGGAVIPAFCLQRGHKGEGARQRLLQRKREENEKRWRGEKRREQESEGQRHADEEMPFCQQAELASTPLQITHSLSSTHTHTQRTGTLPHKDLPFTSTHTHIQIVLQTSQCLHYIGVGWRKGEGGDVHKKCVCVRATLIHLWKGYEAHQTPRGN